MEVSWWIVAFFVCVCVDITHFSSFRVFPVLQFILSYHVTACHIFPYLFLPEQSGSPDAPVILV